MAICGDALHFKCRGMIAERDEQIEDLQAEIERLTKASRADPLSTAQLRIEKQAHEIERLRALVQEHITVHNCLVCGSEL